MSTIGQQFQSLAFMDVNNDNHLNKSEVEFWKKMGQDLGKDPSVKDMDQFYKKLSPAEQKMAEDTGRNNFKDLSITL